MAGEELAKALNDRKKRLQADRVNFNTTWERIARVVLPTSIGFTTTYAPGTNLNMEIFDSTAQLALPRFAAAIDTLITPQTSKWHNLVPRNRTLLRRPDIQRFCAGLNDLLFSARYAPKANFASRAYETYMGLGAFGNGALYIHDARPGIRYISIHLSEIWFDEDHNGVIDTAFWVHEYTARQAVQRFGDKLPEKMRKDAETAPDKKIKFCKAVYPRAERNPRAKDARNMPFASVTFMDGDECVIVEESGYRTFPFAVARYVTAPREIYARGPAQDALSDILTLQEMAKTSLRYGQLVTDPPWMAADGDSLDPFAVRPGAINYGYLSPDGQDRIKPLRPQGETGFTLELMNQRRQSVNGAFLINLFQVLIEQQGDRKTATEVMQLVQEKGALLGPVGGRLRTEFLGNIIDRELDILFHAGAVDFEDIPPELIEDGGLDTEYDSPLTRAIKAEEGVGILRTLESAVQLAQFDQKIARRVNSGRVLERLSDINGAPPDILFTAEEVAEQDQADQAQAQAAQIAEALPGIAKATKDFAEARKIGQDAGPTPGVI
jgi:Bacteriophage head to tail connecting protein